ncbi:MAG: RelA/SpoT family protein [Candidatus Altimarinota bacterium]
MKLEELYKRKLQPYFPAEQGQVLEKVLEHAHFLYDSLYRYSGESYYLRALRLTTEKILKLNPDQATIIASILISACYSPRCDLEKIERLFGEEVRGLVESLGKINSIKSRYSASDTKVISKMFITLAYDFRVILIRLADRIENMETLEFKSLEKQKANAREILDVYVPIASRLGLYDMCLTLEDLAFKYIYPQEYQNLKKDLDEYMSQSEQDMERVKKEIEVLLKQNGLKARVSARIKNIYSIYKKLKRKTATLSDVYDIYAMRIILPSYGEQVDNSEDIEKLYAVLSLLNSKYQTLPDRFKDYVAHPKKNGYQSLHTAVIGLDAVDAEKPTEIQIRTELMHRFAENGFAAHWAYKESSEMQNEEKLLRALEDLRNNLVGSDIRTIPLKMNLYEDKVFALTPDNLVVDLPKEATPLDFAYAIHTEVGHACYLAKVNGSVVPLDYHLKSGDIVEIVRSPKPAPKLSWLGFVKTKLARNRIKNYFRSLNHETLLDQGRDSLDELLEKANLPALDDQYSFLKTYKGRSTNLKDREIILESIGAGRFTAMTAFKNAYGKSFDVVMSGAKVAQQMRSPLPMRGVKKITSNSTKLVIGGETNMPYRLSSCCKPKLTDELVAYITKAKGVSVHKVGCRFLKNTDASRLLEAKLESGEGKSKLNKYHVSMLLEMNDQKDCLKNVVGFLEDKSVTVLDFALVKRDGDLITRKMVVDIYDEKHLQELMKSLGMISGVRKISRD